jgi:hypothetical protein
MPVSRVSVWLVVSARTKEGEAAVDAVEGEP